MDDVRPQRGKSTHESDINDKTKTQSKGIGTDGLTGQIDGLRRAAFYAVVLVGIALLVTMLASTMVFIFLEPYAGVGYGLILLALGYALWSKGGEANTEPSPTNDEKTQTG